MAKHESLIARLCEASEGSKELSRQFWVAMGAVMPATSPCLTTSLSAAWEEAKRKGYLPLLEMLPEGEGFLVILWTAGLDIVAECQGQNEACTILAALLAAEGER